MMRSSEIVSLRQSSVSTEVPSRMIVIWSATFEISFSLCEMMIDAMPCFLKSSRRFSSFWLSLSFSDAVGSSRMSSLTFLASALAISTSCCLPIPMLVISVSGFSSRPTRARSSRVRAKARSQSMMPNRDVSLPRNMFSAIDRSGTSASSWWMMMIPRCSDSEMSRNDTVLPS